MRAVAVLLRLQLRRHWASWLALVVLVAVVAGVLVAANPLAVLPAFLAARPRPAQPLRAG